MATGKRKVDIYLKKFLTQQQITENFFDYLEDQIHDVFGKVYPVSGVFEPDTLVANILSASAPDSFNLTTPLRGTDGSKGNLLVLDPIDASLINFENSLSIPYYVGLRFNRIPRETEINVRTGEIKYTFLEEAIGELAEPNSVTDDGDETLTLKIDSVCEPGVSHAGRKAIVWLKRAQSQAQAFEEVTVIWDGVNNKIETLTALGQTIGNISTDPSDYQVFLKGPSVRRNTDLRINANIVFLGIVTGAGAGNTPTIFDESDVNNYAVSLPELIALFLTEHSPVDGTHTHITPEKITTKQSIQGVQLDTQVNASDEDSPDVPVAHTLFPSSGGSGLQAIKWRLRNALGIPLAFIDAHGNAYFQKLAAVSSVFQSTVIVEGDQTIQGNTTLGDDINTDKVTFNSVLQSLTDLLFVIDADNNGTGHAHRFFNHGVSPANEVFRITETGLLRIFGNIETANPTLSIDLDSDNATTGELFQITKNGGLTLLLQLLETGSLKLFNKIITPNAGFSIDLDSDANSTGESFSITKDNSATTLWQVNESGDSVSTRDTLTGTGNAYKKADGTEISANVSLNETSDETLFRKLLKAIPNNPNSKIVNIAPSRITAADGSDFVIPIKNTISEYNGGSINFQSGVVIGGGANFTPHSFSGNAGKWAKYSINFLQNNTLLVLPATGAGVFAATKALAANPPLAPNAISTAIIAVQDDGSAGVGTILNIAEANIDRLPAAGGGGGGSEGVALLSPKAKAICYTDGSTEEFNCDPPSEHDGKMRILLQFEIENGDFVEVYKGEKKIPQFVNDNVTPGPYWRLPESSIIEFDQDYRTDSPAELVEILVFSNAPEVTPTPSVLAGLDLKGRAFAYSDGSGTPSHVLSTTPVAGKTTIVTDLEVKQSDIVFMSINGEYYPKFIDTLVTPGKSWKLIGSSTFELDSDISGSPFPIDIQVFTGKSFIDENGNVVISLKAKADLIYLQSPDTVLWALGVSNLGELTPDSVPSGLVEPIRLRRDGDNVICEIQIDNDGELAVEDAPSPGIVVDSLHLISPNGLAWRVGIFQNNSIYLEDGYGNKFCLKDDLGNVLFQANETLNGATWNQKYFSDKTLLPNPPTFVSGTIPVAYAYDADLDRVVEYIWTQGQWRALLFTEQLLSGNLVQTPIGSVVMSPLSEPEFSSQPGGINYFLCDGRTAAGTQYQTLFGKSAVPDMRDMFVRGKNNGRSDAYTNPEGEQLLESPHSDWYGYHSHNFATVQDDGNNFTGFPNNNNFGVFKDNGGRVVWGPSPPFAAGVVPNGFDETRPRHIIMNYFIRVN